MNQKLLILDLDETLIYATTSTLDRDADFEVGEDSVYLRPGVETFLKLCREHFKVAVWTSSTESYAEGIVRNLFDTSYPLEFIWARKRCTYVFNGELQSHEWVKDLKKVRRRGYDLDEVIMVDDTPRKLARNYGNLVCVRSFEGDHADRELELLGPYLLTLRDVQNVRSIEKRGWRVALAMRVG